MVIFVLCYTGYSFAHSRIRPPGIYQNLDSSFSHPLLFLFPSPTFLFSLNNSLDSFWWSSTPVIKPSFINRKTMLLLAKFL